MKKLISKPPTPFNQTLLGIFTKIRALSFSGLRPSPQRLSLDWDPQEGEEYRCCLQILPNASGWRFLVLSQGEVRDMSPFIDSLSLEATVPTFIDVTQHNSPPRFLPDPLSETLQMRIEAWQPDPYATVSILVEPSLDWEGITPYDPHQAAQQLDLKLKIIGLRKAQLLC